MSSIPNIFEQPDDPRGVELLRSLVEKTHQGKIPWVKQAGAFTASIPGGLQINFVLSPTLFMNSATLPWQLLTVRDRSGSEILRVDHPILGFLMNPKTAKSTLVETADQLFKLVSGAAGDDLDRAIDAIKKL